MQTNIDRSDNLPSADCLAEHSRSLFSSALNKGIDQVEIDFSFSDGFCVSAREGCLETVEKENTQGVSLTVYHHKAVGTATTTDTSFPGITE